MVLVGMAAGGVKAMRWMPGWRECSVLCKFVEASQCKCRRGESDISTETNGLTEMSGKPRELV